MNKHSLASSLSPFVLASLLLASSGCSVQTIGGVEPNGSGGAGSSTAVTAVAILGSHVPADTTGYLTGLGQIDVKPDTLYVLIGNFDESCADPFMPACEDVTPTETLLQWQVVVGLPASLQQEGMLTLPETGVDDVVAIGGTGPDNAASTCGAGPDGLKGEVEVASIDATQVTLHFMGAQAQEYAPQGPPPTMTAEYTASRCP
jgi:hypothetical protein